MTLCMNLVSSFPFRLFSAVECPMDPPLGPMQDREGSSGRSPPPPRPSNESWDAGAGVLTTPPTSTLSQRHGLSEARVSSRSELLPSEGIHRHPSKTSATARSQGFLGRNIRLFHTVFGRKEAERAPSPGSPLPAERQNSFQMARYHLNLRPENLIVGDAHSGAYTVRDDGTDHTFLPDDMTQLCVFCGMGEADHVGGRGLPQDDRAPMTERIDREEAKFAFRQGSITPPPPSRATHTTPPPSEPTTTSGRLMYWDEDAAYYKEEGPRITPQARRPPLLRPLSKQQLTRQWDAFPDELNVPENLQEARTHQARLARQLSRTLGRQGSTSSVGSSGDIRHMYAPDDFGQLCMICGQPPQSENHIQGQGHLTNDDDM